MALKIFEKNKTIDVINYLLLSYKFGIIKIENMMAYRVMSIWNFNKYDLLTDEVLFIYLFIIIGNYYN